MANDRLFIKCTKCGDTHTLAKYWGGGEFQLPAPMSIEGRANTKQPLDEWLQHHAQDCHACFASNLEAKTLFVLVTESSD